MRTIDFVFFAVVASCSSRPSPVKPVTEAAARCTDLGCITANEGKVIDLDGTFAFPTDPTRKGKHLYRLVLADGTSVVLHAKHEKLEKQRDGQPMTVRGVVYTDAIPERYGIIARTSDPYCVEVYDVR
jgi:hypothetical protein